MKKTFEITTTVTFLYTIDDEVTPRRDGNRTDAGVALDQASSQIAASLGGVLFEDSYVRSIGGEREQTEEEWRDKAKLRNSYIQK